MSYCGHVFDRASRTPLTGIPVSDGRNVAYTDAEGAFSLEGWERARVISVCVLTRNHDDWFLNIATHRGNFDFFIDRIDASAEEFSFLHVSDTEIDNPEHARWLPFAADCVERRKPLFFMHTGDLGRISVDRHYLYLNRETVGCPVRYAIGNHDYVGEDYGESVYERYYGPTWYFFDCGKIRFIVLSIGKGDRPSGYSFRDQWIWMEQLLDSLPEGHRVIVFQHDNCRYDERGFAPVIEGHRYDLRGRGLLGWFFGHFHYHYFHDYDGVYHVCTARPDSGGIDSSEGGIREVRLRGIEVSSEMLDRLPPEGACDPFLWQTQLEGRVTFSTPVDCEGDVLVGTVDNGFPKHCGIYRLSGATGGIVWRFVPRDSVCNEVAYDGERVYATDSQGYLYCLNAATGVLLWERYCSLSRASRTRSNVLLVGDKILAGSPAHVYAFQKNDGTLLWDRFVGQCECTPARYVYDEKRNRLIVSSHWVGLGSIDLATGEPAWLQREHPIWFRTSTPIVIGDEIYSCGNRTLYVISAENGEILRQVPSGMRTDVSGAPLLLDGELFFPTVDSGVIAVNLQTLERRIAYPTGTTVFATSPYVAGETQTVEGSPQLWRGLLLFAGSDGGVYLYDRESGEQKGRIAVGRPITVAPLLQGDTAVVADFLGRVTKFQL